MRKLNLHSGEWIRELIHASVRTSRESHFLHRLHCVLLVAENRSCYEIARWFNVNPRTIQRWVRAFDNHGVEGLRQHRLGGRRAKLIHEQMRCLLQDLQKPPCIFGYSKPEWSGKLLAQHVERYYRIELSARQCQRIIRELAHPEASKKEFEPL